jgi:aldehyde dehydrogenase (NAD+)
VAARVEDQRARRGYIGGEFVELEGQERIPVFEAASAEIMAEVTEATPGDVDRAVRAAHGALPEWSATPPAERAAALSRWHQAMEARGPEFATSISREVGTPIRHSRSIQVGNPLAILAHTVDALSSMTLTEQVGNCIVALEPVGVVGAITPWNYPLQQVVAKVAPALAAGCTVVLKASEVAPLTAFILAETAGAAGLPPGALNVLSGRGELTGEALVTHPLVDKISFTGSTRAGRRIAELAGSVVRPVTLELGGKSASLVLDDADLATAAKFAVYNAFLNSGQTCTALTRLVVPRARIREAEEVAAATAAKLVPGDPLDEATRLGPLASESQLERVRGYIRLGIAEGARLVCGGPEPPAGRERGYYVQPTIFSDVEPSMTVAQEEIFGPVLCIIGHDGDDHALEIANGTPYGLAGAVWSSDQQRALATARRLRAGTVEVNGGAFSTEAPFGGVRQSGYGREFGRYGIEEFLAPKSLQL